MVLPEGGGEGGAVLCKTPPFTPKPSPAARSVGGGTPPHWCLEEGQSYTREGLDPVGGGGHNRDLPPQSV